VDVPTQAAHQEQTMAQRLLFKDLWYVNIYCHQNSQFNNEELSIWH